MDWCVNDDMPGSDGGGNLVISKKTLVEILTLGQAVQKWVEIRLWARPVQLGTTVG